MEAPDPSATTRILLSIHPSRGAHASLLKADTALLGHFDRETSWYLLTSGSTPEALELLLEGSTVQLATAETPATQSRPLPPELLSAYAWNGARFDSIRLTDPTLDKVRLLYRPCATFLESELAPLETYHALAEMVETADKTLWLVTHGDTEISAQLYRVRSSSAARDRAAERAVFEHQIVWNPTAVTLGGQAYVIRDDGLIARLGDSPEVISRAYFPRSSTVTGRYVESLTAGVGVSGPRGDEIFVMSTPQEDRRAVLYRQRLGSDAWTAFEITTNGDYRPDCGTALDTSLYPLPDGTLRFTVQTGHAGVFDPETGRFSLESMISVPEMTCRVSTALTPRFGEVGVVGRTFQIGSLVRRDASGWTEVLADRLISGKGIRQVGDELYVYVRGQGIRGVHLFPSADLHVAYGFCEDALATGNEARFARTFGDRIYYEVGSAMTSVGSTRFRP